MRAWVVFLVFLYTTTQASDVIELTDADFWEKTKEGVWAFEVYAPWCGHCKRLEPIWSELATTLKGSVNVAKIDGTTQTTLARKFKIRGYPTITLAKAGKLYSFSGNRDLESLLTWVKGDHVNSEHRLMFSPPGSFDSVIRVVEDLARQLLSLLSKHTMATLGFLGVGFFLGAIIAALFLVKKRKSSLDNYLKEMDKDKKKLKKNKVE